MFLRGLWITVWGLSVSFALMPLSSTAAHAQSEQQKPTLKPFDISLAKIGTTRIRIRYRFVGEPISQPERFEVRFKCAGKRGWRSYRDYPICGLNAYRYDAGTGKLSISYLYGRVVPETGQSFCDMQRDDEIDIADWCKTPTSAHAQ